MFEIKSHLIFSLLTTIILCLFVNCQKRDTDSLSEPNGDGTQIVFNAVGLEDELIISAKKNLKINYNRGIGTSKENVVAKDLFTGNNQFDAVLTVLENDVEISSSNHKSHQNKNIGKSSISTQNRAIIPILGGSRYRVVLYDNDTYVATLDCIAGTEFKFAGANRNRTYTWFAYSYNNTSIMPPLANNVDPKLHVPGESGFLYSSGTITTSNVVKGSNRLEIVFQRHTANIELVIDARGMFGNILDISGSTTNAGSLRSGTFDLRKGSYSSTFIGNTSNISFNFSNFANFNLIHGAMIKRMSFYTAAGGEPIIGWRINLSTLQIEGDRRVSPAAIPGSAAWGNPHNFTNITYNVPTFTPELGKRYRIVMTLIATGKGLNNTQWARGNLYLHSSGDYRFRLHPASHVYGTVSSSSPFTTSAEAGEFFNWKAFTAISNTANVGSASTQDPCMLVYPSGRWRMPTANDVTALSTSIGRSFQTAGTTDPINNTDDSPTLNRQLRRIQYVFAESDLPYDETNRLSFPLFGYRSELNGSYSILNFSTSVGNGYYWTSGQNSSTLGTVIRFNESAATSQKVTTVGFLKTRGANIRCVRESSWDASQIPTLPAADY